MQPALFTLVIACCLMWGCASSNDSGANAPPAAPREFRAAWVATVSNIDWPSEPGLPTAKQQEEALAILDKAQAMNLNAIILQVRPSADALYASSFEPWSYFLTGHQGKAPDPYYDPLQFWITEAHRRRMELHAWFNPYRARHGSARYAAAPNHVSRTDPQIVREFNGWQWLDPAEPAAAGITYNVFLDVVRRYDVDGIHIDDYFYPYPDYLKQKDGTFADFPDDGPWRRYQQSGGKLARADWRRENVNQLIQRVYEGAKKQKPEVKFGISPFGIARPGKPEVVKGFDQYEKLYADTELWLHNGWLDYWTPQLYWKITATSQPYQTLLEYWVSQNTHNRHIWPGLFTSRIGDRENSWPTSEIIDQIMVTRATPGATGHVHFSMKALSNNREGIADQLKSGPYSQPALVPASTWIDSTPPPAPKVKVTRDRVTWNPGSTERPWLWAVWSKRDGAWSFAVYPADSDGINLGESDAPSAVCVSAVDRCGNESKRVIVRTRR
jgi:uncharacterized lipoprotein YddW (UPF0748 family)